MKTIQELCSHYKLQVGSTSHKYVPQTLRKGVAAQQKYGDTDVHYRLFVSPALSLFSSFHHYQIELKAWQWLKEASRSLLAVSDNSCLRRLSLVEARGRGRGRGEFPSRLSSFVVSEDMLITFSRFH